MGKGGGSPQAPAPPNPVDTARAGLSTNVGTSIANAFLGQTNQYTPEGSLRYDQTGSYTWKDPYTGLSLDIPQFSATQQRAPQYQAIEDQRAATQFNLAGLANAQSGRLAQFLANDVNFGEAPEAGDPSAITGVPKALTQFADVGGQQRSLGDYGSQMYGFGDAGDITRSYGPQDSFSADRSRVEDALYGRLNPQLERERSNIESRLSDQGIRYGSDAYGGAMDDYNRQANDARLAVTQVGGQEQQRMMDMAAQQAGFQNAAQQQDYLQQLGRGEFFNQAQGQNFQQMLSAGEFANQAQSQDFSQAALRGQFANQGLAQQLAQAQAGFGAQNTARNQWMQEQYAQRSQPINEINALLSGTQVQNPNYVNTPQNQIPTQDVAGLINNRFSQDMDIYKQEIEKYKSDQAAKSAMIGGLFGMAGGMMKMSDERMKDNVTPIASVLAVNPEGDRKELPVYQYSYKHDPAKQRHVGPMAQDVEKIDKRAVRERKGVKYIDQARVMGSILKAG